MTARQTAQTHKPATPKPRRLRTPSPQESPANDSSPYVWDVRYAAEGHIWGDEPSLTGKTVVRLLRPRSHVLEFGYGYGRDLQEILLHGHSAYGIEKSDVGHTEARRVLHQHIDSGQAQLLLIGDFTKASTPNEGFDAVFSHRVLHLLGKNGVVRAFNAHAARILKPDGLFVVSARNPKDFNPDQMEWIEEGMAQYKPEFKERRGQIIRFWDEKAFRDTFSDNFDIETFIEGTEIESRKNPVDTHFTIMVARRKHTLTP